tara:strand:- start:34 stop:492 length:459 start_codon:yes stop_codon:yes gene_type:complete
MNTKKSVFNKLFGKKSLSKTELKNKKIDLSIVTDIESELSEFEQAASDASYLAYEFIDQAIDAYDEWQRNYPIDDYVINGAIRNLPESTEIMQGYLEKLEIAANELGIQPDEILDDYEYIKGQVVGAESLYTDAKDKMREISSYTGINDFLN